jgi:hypothetical protein
MAASAIMISLLFCTPPAIFCAAFGTHILKAGLASFMQVCHSRNTHGRSREDIASMATAWEECPPLYTLLNVSNLMAAKDAPAEVRGHLHADSGASSMSFYGILGHSALISVHKAAENRQKKCKIVC